MFSSVNLLGVHLLAASWCGGAQKENGLDIMPGSQLFLDLFVFGLPTTHINHALQPLKVVWPKQTSDGEAVKVEAMDLATNVIIYYIECTNLGLKFTTAPSNAGFVWIWKGREHIKMSMTGSAFERLYPA